MTLLQVFQYVLGKLKLLFSTTMSDVQDAEWVDEHTFALAYKVRYMMARTHFMCASQLFLGSCGHL